MAEAMTQFALQVVTYDFLVVPPREVCCKIGFFTGLATLWLGAADTEMARYIRQVALLVCSLPSHVSYFMKQSSVSYRQRNEAERWLDTHDGEHPCAVVLLACFALTERSMWRSLGCSLC